MKIKCLSDYIKFDKDRNIYDLTIPSFIYREDIGLNEYTVRREHNMRIDLLFRDIYDIDETQFPIKSENIDIILYLNNIDNPLNIKEGMIIKYPSNIEDFYKYRMNFNELENEKSNIKDRLIVPNKSTVKDNNRQKYISNNYSLPPVVLDKPRKPVKIENGKFKIGGI